MRKSTYAKTKTQISFAVTAKLISAFVFATQRVQSLFFLNPKFQASSHLLWLYSRVCVGPGRKPECWFTHDAAQTIFDDRLGANPSTANVGAPSVTPQSILSLSYNHADARSCLSQQQPINDRNTFIDWLTKPITDQSIKAKRSLPKVYSGIEITYIR